jgi:hypothetical protein
MHSSGSREGPVHGPFFVCIANDPAPFFGVSSRVFDAPADSAWRLPQACLHLHHSPHILGCGDMKNGGPGLQSMIVSIRHLVSVIYIEK